MVIIIRGLIPITSLMNSFESTLQGLAADKQHSVRNFSSPPCESVSRPHRSHVFIPIRETFHLVTFNCRHCALLNLLPVATWFERISIMVILLNCVTLGMYQPCENIDCTSDRCQILQVSSTPLSCVCMM